MTVRKRGQHWHYQFMVEGTRYYGVLEDAKNKEEAKKLETEEWLKVRRGQRVQVFGRDRFKTFVHEEYLKYSKEYKASWRHDEFRCAMLCEYFGNKRFGEITTMQVVAFIKSRLTSKVKRYRQKSEATRIRSAVTVSKEVVLLSSIFRMAMREKVATENPCDGIPKTVRRLLKTRNRRRCPLDDQRERALIEKGLIGRYAHLRGPVLFELNTGLRLSELRRLERDHVNLESDSKWFDIGGESWEVPWDCFIVPRTKNGKPRVIPLNSQAKAIVRHQLGDVTIDRYVFPSTKAQKGEIRSNMIKEVKKGFAGACRAAGLKYGQYDVDGITFHTLRHRFNSKLDALGVSKSVRRDLLGHTPGDLTDDYTHSTTEQRRQAVELLCHNRSEEQSSSQPIVARFVATA